MRISGFTMVKNATKLYYPVRQSIASVLPIVDEFVVALGNCDEDDETRKEIEAIKSDKIRIIDTIWDTQNFPNGTENAHQTDIAKEACTGDWLFYLQADEVVHEHFLPEIERKCGKFLTDQEVEGFLFNYVHFWGDYHHYVPNHGWYPKEIRIIRNDPDIHSWRSAQSFRRIPNFDGKSYRQKEGTYKLKVIRLDAYIYHYGWVRPPELMQQKKTALGNIHKSKGEAEEQVEGNVRPFDYGYLDRLPRFEGTHPEVMQDRIKQFDWEEALKPEKVDPERKPYKHEKINNRLLTFFEQNVLGGHQIFGHSNWKLLNKS